MVKMYITPMGKTISAESADCPEIYQHQDYKDYALAMNSLATIWMDMAPSSSFVDIIHKVSSIQLAAFHPDCNHKAFLFGFCAAVVQLSNNIPVIAGLIELAAVADESERTISTIEKLLEKYSKIPDLAVIDFAAIFPSSLSQFSVRQALQLLIRQFLVTVANSLERSFSTESVAGISNISDVANRAAVNIGCQLVYVRWLLARPESFLSIQNSSQSMQKMQAAFERFFNVKIKSFLFEMGKISEEDGKWFDAEGFEFFRNVQLPGATDIKSVNKDSVDRFMVGLLKDDQSQLASAMTHLIGLLSISQQSSVDRDMLQEKFQGFLSCFKTMVFSSIETYSIFFIDSSVDDSLNLPAIDEFYQRNGQELLECCMTFWIESVKGGEDFNYFFDFFNKIKTLIETKGDLLYLKEKMYAQLVKLYHFSLSSDLELDKKKTFSFMELLSKKEDVVFFLNTVCFLIDELEKKIDPKVALLLLDPFKKIRDSDEVGIFSCLESAQDIFVKNKERILSTLRRTQFYSKAEMRKNLSLRQLFEIANDFLEIKNLFGLANDRFRNYFEMICYKQCCEEISGKNFDHSIDCFLDIIEGIKEKGSDLNFENSELVSLFLFSCIRLLRKINYFPHEIKIIQIIVFVSQKASSNKEIQLFHNTFKTLKEISVSVNTKRSFGDLDLESFRRDYAALTLQIDSSKSDFERNSQKPLWPAIFPGEPIVLKIQELTNVKKTAEEISWENYKSFLHSNSLKNGFSMATVLLRDSATLKEGLLLASSVFLRAMHLNDGAFIEKNIKAWFFILSEKRLVFFEEGAYYLWHAKLKTIKPMDQGLFGEYFVLYDLIQRVVSFLSLFYDNGLWFSEEKKKQISTLLNTVYDVFSVIHSEPITTIIDDPVQPQLEAEIIGSNPLVEPQIAVPSQRQDTSPSKPFTSEGHDSRDDQSNVIKPMPALSTETKKQEIIPPRLIEPAESTEGVKFIFMTDLKQLTVSKIMPKQTYITPMGNQLMAEFPQVYNHEDYQAYAIAIDELARIWMDFDLVSSPFAGQILLIKELVFKPTCTDRSFVFSPCAAVVQLSNSISYMAQLMRLMAASLESERSTLTIKELLDKYSERLSLSDTDIATLCPEYLRGAPVHKALKFFIRNFLFNFGKGVQTELLSSLERLRKAQPDAVGIIINCLCGLAYVSWVLERPGNFLAIEKDKSAGKLSEVFQRLSMPEVLDSLRAMGKISLENEQWLQEEGLDLFKGLTSLDAVNMTSVDKFLTGLLLSDRCRLIPVVSHLTDLLSISSQPLVDNEMLQNKFQALLSSFKEMALFYIKTYSIFWTGTETKKNPPKPFLEALYHRDGVKLPIMCSEILSEKSFGSLGYHRFFEFFDSLIPFLTEARYQEHFFQQTLYVELVKLYHIALRMVDNKNRKLAMLKGFENNEYILFFINILHSVIETIQKKVEPETVSLFLSEFSRQVKYDSINDVLGSLAAARDLYFQNKDQIISAARSLSYYANPKIIESLSLRQLFEISEKIFAAKELFGQTDRSEDYFGMIFYKEACQEIAGKEFDASIDFFSIILEQIKAKARALDYNVPGMTDCFLNNCVEFGSGFHFLPHKMRIMEAIEIALGHGYPNREIQKNIKHFIQSGKNAFGDTVFIEQYNLLTEKLDRLEHELQVFCGAKKDKVQAGIKLPGDPIELRSLKTTIVVKNAEISWSDYQGFLTSGKPNSRLSMATALLNDPNTLKEGILLMSCLFLNALQSRDVGFVEKNIESWFRLLSVQLKFVSFAEGAHCLWDTKLKTISPMPQEQSGEYAELFSVIRGSVYCLKSFYDNGMLLSESNKKEVKKLLRTVDGVFHIIHPMAESEDVKQSKSLMKTEEVKTAEIAMAASTVTLEKVASEEPINSEAIASSMSNLVSIESTSQPGVITDIVGVEPAQAINQDKKPSSETLIVSALHLEAGYEQPLSFRDYSLEEINEKIAEVEGKDWVKIKPKDQRPAPKRRAHVASQSSPHHKNQTGPKIPVPTPQLVASKPPIIASTSGVAMRMAPWAKKAENVLESVASADYSPLRADITVAAKPPVKPADMAEPPTETASSLVVAADAELVTVEIEQPTVATQRVVVSDMPVIPVSGNQPILAPQNVSEVDLAAELSVASQAVSPAGLAAEVAALKLDVERLKAELAQGLSREARSDGRPPRGARQPRGGRHQSRGGAQQFEYPVSPPMYPLPPPMYPLQGFYPPLNFYPPFGGYAMQQPPPPPVGWMAPEYPLYRLETDNRQNECIRIYRSANDRHGEISYDPSLIRQMKRP